MESDKLTADGVEVTGYPELSRKYRISGVPKTVVGENHEFVGARPEPVLLDYVRRAAETGSLVS